MGAASMEGLPEHSPLGASGAHRWMVCPGSVQLSEGIEDPESEYAAQGTAAHALMEYCLRTGEEPWTLIKRGDEPGEGYTLPNGDELFVDKEMADCVDGFVRVIGEWGFGTHAKYAIEEDFHCPSLHRLYYGRADYWVVSYDPLLSCHVLDVWDYKHGAGIMVDATDNPQLRYYGCGVLEEHELWDDVDRVRLHIYQPRGWHPEGAHRFEEMSVEDLDAWLGDVLLPAMERAEVSRDTQSGEHCRFCPARLAQCPALMRDMAELEELLLMANEVIDNKGKGAEALTPEQLGRIIQLNEIHKIVLKGALKTAHALESNGHKVPGVKLVKSRTNREFKDGADKAAVKKFGEKLAYTTPVLKSPAQIDTLPGGTEFTARWAFKPEGGTTIVVEGDPRREIKRDAKSLFKPVVK